MIDHGVQHVGHHNQNIKLCANCLKYDHCTWKFSLHKSSCSCRSGLYFWDIGMISDNDWITRRLDTLDNLYILGKLCIQ
jgi:hypothetical protein